MCKLCLGVIIDAVIKQQLLLLAVVVLAMVLVMVLDSNKPRMFVTLKHISNVSENKKFFI